jgi:hypothetical protein
MPTIEAIDITGVERLVLIGDSDLTVVRSCNCREYNLPPQSKHRPAEVAASGTKPNQLDALITANPSVAHDLADCLAGHGQRRRFTMNE